MAKFIKYSILFALGIGLVISTGLMLPNNNAIRSVDYSIIAKHKNLQNAKSPKLILTGGSNVLFGFNSKIISDNLHIPVINHSIHAGYGLKYIIEDVIPFAKAGDIIVLSPEYSHFIGTNYLGKEPLLFSLTAKPENLKHISINQIFNVAEFIPKFSFDRMKSFIYNLVKGSIAELDYSKDYGEFSINEFGDHYTHWNKKPTELKIYNFNGEVNIDVIRFLEEKNQELKNKGVKLIISYPSLCLSTYSLNEATINNIHKHLLSSSLSVIDTPLAYSFKDSLFYDSSYHLTGAGVIKRSLKLSTQLNAKIND